jgi:chromosome segregation ATPase
LQRELQETQQQLAAAKEKLAELATAGSELKKMQKDQEDLLELLTDQDMRLNQFKAQLRALGEKASHTLPLYEASFIYIYGLLCILCMKCMGRMHYGLV